MNLTIRTARAHTPSIGLDRLAHQNNRAHFRILPKKRMQSKNYSQNYDSHRYASTTRLAREVTGVHSSSFASNTPTVVVTGWQRYKCRGLLCGPMDHWQWWRSNGEYPIVETQYWRKETQYSTDIISLMPLMPPTSCD